MSESIMDLVGSRRLVGWKTGGFLNTTDPKEWVLCVAFVHYTYLASVGSKDEKGALSSPLRTFDR